MSHNELFIKALKRDELAETTKDSFCGEIDKKLVLDIEEGWNC